MEWIEVNAARDQTIILQSLFRGSPEGCPQHIRDILDSEKERLLGYMSELADQDDQEEEKKIDRRAWKKIGQFFLHVFYCAVCYLIFFALLYGSRLIYEHFTSSNQAPLTPWRVEWERKLLWERDSLTRLVEAGKRPIPSSPALIRTPAHKMVVPIPRSMAWQPDSDLDKEFIQDVHCQFTYDLINSLDTSYGHLIMPRGFKDSGHKYPLFFFSHGRGQISGQ